MEDARPGGTRSLLAGKPNFRGRAEWLHLELEASLLSGIAAAGPALQGYYLSEMLRFVEFHGDCLGLEGAFTTAIQPLGDRLTPDFRRGR